jgi:hypothetical protein
VAQQVVVPAHSQHSTPTDGHRIPTTYRAEDTTNVACTKHEGSPHGALGMPSKIIRRPSIDRRNDGIKADVGETDGKVARADIVENPRCKRDQDGKADQNDGLSSDNDGVAATVLVGEQRAAVCCNATYDVGRNACTLVIRHIWHFRP